MVSNKQNRFDKANTQLSGAWGWIGRGTWLALTIICLAYFLIVWVAELRQPPVDCLLPNANCNPTELSANDIAIIQDSGFPVQSALNITRGLNLATNVVFLLTAMLIFWRKANDRVALFVSGTVMMLGGVGFSPDTPDWLVNIPVLNGLFTIIALISYVSPLLLLFFFPDGRFVPSWSRFVVLGLSLLTIANIFLSLFGSSSGLDPFFLAYFLALAISTLIGIGCVVYRYRHIANPQQQQQLKWVAFGFLCATSAVLLWFFYSTFLPPEQPSPTRTYAVFISYFILFFVSSLFPVCVMIAVLRYRLFEIDILIRRTLQYSILTGLLALVYFGGVVLFQAIFRTASGETSPLAVVLSTLIIAALFAPLRRRIQNLIDRRFFRKKYDAQQVLAQFAVAVRDEMSLEALTAELIRVVQETMQPETMSVWLKSAAPRQAFHSASGEEYNI